MSINLDLVNPEWLHEPKIEVEKADAVLPPGPPSRPGLEWKPITHRWIRSMGVEEMKFHNVTKVDYDKSLRIVADMKDEIDKLFPGTDYDDEIQEKARWCVHVFETALEDIAFRDRPGITDALVYVNDKGEPEVACTWFITNSAPGWQRGGDAGKALFIDMLATNPKNLVQAKSSDKTHGAGTAALYRVLEEAVKSKVTRIVGNPIFDSKPFYEKLGGHITKGGMWEFNIDQAKDLLTEAGMIQKDNHLEELIDLESKHGVLLGPVDLMKAMTSAPPGPPPRPGLEWKFTTHRWIRPEKGTTKTKSGLPIPPGWSDVWINSDPTADVQAIGRDSQGRKVRLTTAAHKEAATAVIMARLKEFTPYYQDLSAKIISDMDSNEEAAALYTIMQTGYRIGSDRDTKAKVKAYGVSTLKHEHVSVSGNTVHFKFIAKKGVPVDNAVTDPKLAMMMKERIKDGGDVFDTSDDKIRDYFHRLPNMDRFKVKDIRTYVATQTALQEMKKMQPPTDKHSFAKQRMAVAKAVAAKIGNTPAVSLKHYIAPEVFLEWQTGISNMVKKSGDETLKDFLETTFYAEKIPWEELPFPDPDDEDDTADELVKARRYKRDDENPPEDPPLGSSRMTVGGTGDLEHWAVVPKPQRPEGAPPGPPPREGLVWKPESHRWISIEDVPIINIETQFKMVGDGCPGKPEDKWTSGAGNRELDPLYKVTEKTDSEVWHRKDNPLWSRRKNMRQIRDLARFYPLEAKNLMLALQTYVEAADPSMDVKEEKLDKVMKLFESNVSRVIKWTNSRLDLEMVPEGIKMYRKKLEELEHLASEIRIVSKYGDKSSKIKVLDKLMSTAHVFEKSLIPQFVGVDLMHDGVDFALFNEVMGDYLDWLREEVKCYDTYASDLMKALTLETVLLKSVMPGRKFNPPKPKSRFYLETPDAHEVYENWAKERFERGEKILVETKFNGFRTTISKDMSNIDIWFEDRDDSRAKVVPEIAAELRRTLLDVVLDGETMIYQGDKPVARIHMARLLGDEIRLNPDERIVIVLFDIPYLKKDLSDTPLIERKRVLRKFFNENLVDSKHFIVSDYAITNNESTFMAAVKNAAKQPASEGAILKEATSEFKQGPIDSWAKVKSILELKVRVLGKKKAGSSFVYECGLIDG